MLTFFDRGRPTKEGWVVVGAVALLAAMSTVLVGMLVFKAARRDDRREVVDDSPRPPVPARTEPTARERPDPPPVERKVEPKPTPKTPAPPPPPTFDSDFEKAEEILAAYEAKEPAVTQRALKLLNDSDRANMKILMLRAASDSNFLADFVLELIPRGLGEWARVNSARLARGDSQFIEFAKKLWHPKMGGSGLAEMARRWFIVSPSYKQDAIKRVMSNAPTGTLYPETKKVILDLGGEDWLLRDR